MPSIDSGNCLSHTLFRTLHRSPLTTVNALFFKNNYSNLNIFIQDCCISFKKTAIDAGPIGN